MKFAYFKEQLGVVENPSEKEGALIVQHHMIENLPWVEAGRPME